MRGIRLKEPTIIALETMRSHKLRSFLMLLGVILSVSTLILVVALINGTNAYIADRVANMGNGFFSSRASASSTAKKHTSRRRGATSS